jgi:prepilin-type N-terminal cleavage/methylation domain-containing protein
MVDHKSLEKKLPIGAGSACLSGPRLADCKDITEMTIWMRRTDGFTLIEMMLVVALIGILAGMAVPITAGFLTTAKADSTGIEVTSWLETARARAVAERRNFEVTFDTGTNHVMVQRVEPNLTKTTILDRELPEGMKFVKFAVSDTPDLFGYSTAIDIDGPAPHMFTSEGSWVDQNGDPSNGTITFGKSGQNQTARAITIFGVSGLTRRWKLTGSTWTK